MEDVVGCTIVFGLPVFLCPLLTRILGMSRSEGWHFFTLTEIVIGYLLLGALVSTTLAPTVGIQFLIAGVWIILSLPLVFVLLNTPDWLEAALEYFESEPQRRAARTKALEDEVLELDKLIER